MTPDALVQIDVTPADALERRARLFAALEAAFPVRFRAAGNGRPDGTVAFVVGGPDAHVPAMDGPTLALVDVPPADGGHTFGPISFGDSRLLPQPFRGRTLTDASPRGGELPGAFVEWGEVLATSADGPVWSARGELQHIAVAWPEELGPGHAVREQLTAGRFMGLLPLVHFLQQLAKGSAWEQPVSRACFVFDDPNVHWWSYGFLDYRELSAHAKAHGYHVTAATIPLDQWYVHGATASFLRQEDSRISFAIHGNNHTSHELRQVDEPAVAAALATQALRRSNALRRAGLDVAPVMVPPFGVCSGAMLSGCLQAGFDALCADWPYWWLTDPGPVLPLSGWHPVDRLRGLPVIPRLHVIHTDLSDDLVFRAFLGQPLILYGHHTDLASGLDLLAMRVDHLRSLGVETWEPLARIAQNVVAMHRRGDSLAVTLYTNSATVEIPEGVVEAEFVFPGGDASDVNFHLEIEDGAGPRPIGIGEPVPVEAGAVVVTLRPESAAPAVRSGRPAGVARAAVRRVLTECRDRSVPWSKRLGLGAGLRKGSTTWLAVVGCCLVPW